MNDLAESPRIVHMGSKVNHNGRVSPLCADKPKGINMARETWTISPKGVTCPKCRERLRDQ